METRVMETSEQSAAGDRGARESNAGGSGSALEMVSVPHTRRDYHRSAVLNELVGLIGEPATLKLVQGFGGSRVYVPQTPESKDSLAGQIGLEAASKLARIYGGDRLEVPNPTSRKTRILELRRSGVSVDGIARQLGCTRRRVFQVLAEVRR